MRKIILNLHECGVTVHPPSSKAHWFKVEITKGAYLIELSIVNSEHTSKVLEALGANLAQIKSTVEMSNLQDTLEALIEAKIAAAFAERERKAKNE
jgi:hypothetical protein